MLDKKQRFVSLIDAMRVQLDLDYAYQERMKVVLGKNSEVPVYDTDSLQIAMVRECVALTGREDFKEVEADIYAFMYEQDFGRHAGAKICHAGDFFDSITVYELVGDSSSKKNKQQ